MLLTLPAHAAAVAPMQGFVLADPAVDEVIRVAKEIEGTQLYADPAYPPTQTVDVLLRSVRLLQIALEVQFSENEQLTSDYNRLNDDYQVGHLHIPA